MLRTGETKSLFIWIHTIIGIPIYPLVKKRSHARDLENTTMIAHFLTFSLRWRLAFNFCNATNTTLLKP